MSTSPLGLPGKYVELKYKHEFAIGKPLDRLLLNIQLRSCLRNIRLITSTGQETIYTSDQKDDVIHKLNSIRTNANTRTILGSTLCSNIEAHLHRKGNFTKLEELLQVQSVGPKSIRTLCDKLLGLSSSKVQAADGKTSRKPRTQVNVVYPPITAEIRAATKILLTLVVDVGSITWALVDSQKKTLLEWKTVEIDKTSNNLKESIITACKIENLLPNSDLYVIESPSLGSAHNRSGYQLKTQLTTALATLIHNNREKGTEFKMVFVKSSLVERHFDASIGSESVSLQPFMQDVIDQKVFNRRSNIFVPHDNVSYLKSLDPFQKEQLCRAALLAISVIDIVLAKKDESPHLI